VVHVGKETKLRNATYPNSKKLKKLLHLTSIIKLKKFLLNFNIKTEINFEH